MDGCLNTRLNIYNSELCSFRKVLTQQVDKPICTYQSADPVPLAFSSALSSTPGSSPRLPSQSAT